MNLGVFHVTRQKNQYFAVPELKTVKYTTSKLGSIYINLYPIFYIKEIQIYPAIMAFIKSLLTPLVDRRKTHHNMAPDEMESLATGQRSLNAKTEKPFHVSGHQPHVINIS